jgi:putative nucleotidyltransferase with HDIG domain
MKIEVTFLSSRVARRIFLLFVICALLPLGALSVLSFDYVTKQLYEQSQKRLHQSGKNIGMTIFERLLLLEAQMQLVSRSIDSESSSLLLDKRLDNLLQTRFTGVSLAKQGGKIFLTIFGKTSIQPIFTQEQMQHIFSGQALVWSLAKPDSPPCIGMAVAFVPQHPDRGFLWGEIKASYLWDPVDADKLPPMTELCIVDQSNNVLFSTLPDLPSLPENVRSKITNTYSDHFSWKYEDVEYEADSWPIFLKAEFYTPRWTAVVSEMKSNVVAPMADFKKTFPYVILLTLWVVLLFSIVQIRKNLVPLEKLHSATQRIAMKDFDSRVTIKSGDEFETLAAAFNTMAQQLGRHFNTLTAMAEIDRAVLSSLETRKIVEAVLTGLRVIFPCDSVSMTLLDPNDRLQAYTYASGNEKEVSAQPSRLSFKQIETFENDPEYLSLHGDDKDLPPCLSPFVHCGISWFLVFPVMLKQKLSAFITLGYSGPITCSREYLAEIRQVVDQVTVALSNTRLVEELDQLNWGTITALARAVDAKSPWTAGHSERVTALALKIGRVVGLTLQGLATLHRGALLHDIGKIGVPARILDKPGKLDDEEYRIIREHSRLGARILEPIAAYAEIIPIVLQHHERFDGKGYPDGLNGEDIALGARILAVADVFDALLSDRPYRAGMELNRVLEIMKEEAGKQFDPIVVQALDEVLDMQEREKRDEDINTELNGERSMSLAAGNVAAARGF